MTNQSNPWHEKSLKLYIQNTIFDTEGFEEFKIDNETSSSIQKSQSDAFKRAREDFTNFDSHVIYTAGGALIVVSQIFISDKATDLYGTTMLMIAFALLTGSLISIVLSFLFVSGHYHNESAAMNKMESFFTLIKALSFHVHKANKLADFKKFLVNETDNPGNERIKNIFDGADVIWNEIRDAGALSDKFARGSNISSWTAYILFILGLLFFLIFGVINISNLSRNSFEKRHQYFEIKNYKF